MMMTLIQLEIIGIQANEHKASHNSVVPSRRWNYRPPIPYNAFTRFTFVGMSDILCSTLTRFTRAEIERFLLLLGLEKIRFRNCLDATPEEALAVVLIRLSYPNRYWEMMDQFSHSRTWLSIIFNDTLIHLYRRYRKKLAWDENRLTYETFSGYAMAIHNLGGGPCFWGFIDGTLNATCRPIFDQEQFYSGHKQKHGYKYQSVVTPDGLVPSLIGPFIGRRGDWKMVELSGISEKLRAVNGGRRPAHALYLYGNPPIVQFMVLWVPIRIILRSLALLHKKNSTRQWPNYELRWSMVLQFIRIYGHGMAIIYSLK